MVTPIASRFACLPVDDDGDTNRRITAKHMNKKKEDQSKPQTSAGLKKPPVKKQNKKKTEQPSSTKQKSNKPKGEKKVLQDQWEQWKQKDAEFVDGHYEDDLRQAMLLSKLDYEEKQEYYGQIKKATDEEKKAGSKKNKKSNKAQPMSLSQFNQMGDKENQAELSDVGGCGDAPLANGKPEPDTEFFDRVKSEAKKAFLSEQAEEERKAREPHIDEIISVAQYQDRLEKRDEEITRLNNVVEALQEELKNVKTRNKKLCQLLLQGEIQPIGESGSMEELCDQSIVEVTRLRCENKILQKKLSGVQTRNKKLCYLLLKMDERQGGNTRGGGQAAESERRAFQ